ncbi:hypothetical protein GYMLUDRAFT_236522 [Collybiopsis luxurians FD-317 M1]|nr:hypothetical protein GYMLUDRAFT_236522 [Collybiopsis luxurians FD-317 M1]
MTPEETVLLSDFGTSLLYQIAALICSSTLYGIYLLMAFVSFYLLVRRGTSNRPRQILLTCLAFVLLTDTWVFINKCAANLIEIWAAIARIHPPGDLTAQIEDGVATLVPFQYIANWPVTFNLLVSDCIVAWRVWVIWNEYKLIKGCLALLVSANIVVNILDCIFDDLAVASFWNTSRWDSAAAFLSLGLNFVATVLIAFKVWRFRVTMKSKFDHHWTPVENILLFLVESGAVYCGLQLIYAILITLTVTSTGITPLNIAKSMIIEFFIGASALYPVSVVIIVERSWSTLDRKSEEKAAKRTVGGF